MRNLALALAASAAMSGCASVGGDALIDTISMPPVPAVCGNGETAGQDRALCDAINQTVESATKYQEAAGELDNAHVTYGLLQTASAIAILGFGMFDAHPDNISAATLTGAIATGARQGIRPDRQRDILIDGVRGMNCVARRGAVFMGAAASGDGLRTYAQGVRDQVSEARAAARAAPASDRATAEAIEAAADDLDAAIAEAMAVVGYRTGVVIQVQEAHASVETAVLTQLRAERPDYAGIIEAIRAGATPAAPEGEGGEESVAGVDTLAEWPDYLRELALALRERTADGPGKQQYDAIMTCVGRT